MNSPVDFFFDFLSPFGYIAAMKVDEIEERFCREFVWHPFLLSVSVVKIMGLRPVLETPLKSDYLIHDMKRMAAYYGVPIVQDLPDKLDSLLASRAYYWIFNKDPAIAKEFAKESYIRLWRDGVSISDLDTVTAIAEGFGVDSVELKHALAGVEIKEILKREMDKTIDCGVFGSPTFLLDGEMIWGVDRLWMLEHWLKHASWEWEPRQ